MFKHFHRGHLFAIAIAAAGFAAAPAAAVSVNINAHEVHTGGPSFWTAATGFNLPGGFINANLQITDFGIDDRGIVALNGTTIDSVGLFAPGNGFLVATLGGSNDPYFYPRGDGLRNVNVTSGFLTGFNQLLFTINDTSAGIFGDLTGGPNGTAGPTAYTFNAILTYDVRGAVPEPAAWALMLGGFGMMGSAMRRQRQTFATVSA